MEKFCQYASTCAYDIMFIDMHECASIFILQGTKMQDKDEIQSPKEVVTPCKIPCDYLSSTTCGPNSNETSIYIYTYITYIIHILFRHDQRLSALLMIRSKPLFYDKKTINQTNI